MNADRLDTFFAELDAWATERAVAAQRIAYGDHGDQFFDLREHSSAGAVDRDAVVVVLHGGFWRPEYDYTATIAVATALVHAGWTTANVEYRRFGQGAYEPLLEDVRTAATALRGKAQTLIAIGHSAGGHLALWLAAQGAVDGAVGLGSICDLTAAARAGFGSGAVDDLLGGGPDFVPAAYAAADPARLLPFGVPQGLVHGRNDDRVPFEHARTYAALAREAGDTCALYPFDGGHFEVIDPRAAVWHTILAALDDVSSAALGTAGRTA